MLTRSSRDIAVLVVLALVAAVGCGDDGTTDPDPAGTATRLGFGTALAGAGVNIAIAPPLEVVVRDAFGNDVTAATNAVTLALGANPGGATLLGTTTVSAVGGVATFANLSIDRPGFGYTLTATSGVLAGAASPPFDVRLGLVNAGVNHTCGLTTAGAAYCWGANGLGQLGDGTPTDRRTPVAVAGGHVFTAVSAGGFHTCGLTTAGAAYCWGNNDEGELGDGTTTGNSSAVAVVGGHVFASVSAGNFHTCGVTTAGTAYCWGYNSSGQLGDGTTTNSSSPVAVVGGHVFASLSGGGVHTCGVTAAGVAYCWGYNLNGQLGDGATTSSSSPVAVVGGHAFASVSAGEGQTLAHTCGVTTAGAAYCWGDNSGGQLGDGTTTNSPSPVAVVGGHVFARASAGSNHSCGVTTDGAAYCWGSNSAGKLGDATTTTGSLSPVAVLGERTFASVSAGPDHACGVTVAGPAYCWGAQSSGRLGDGGTTNRHAPVAVSGSLLFASLDAAETEPGPALAATTRSDLERFAGARPDVRCAMLCLRG